jgi:hypothetical protein
MRITRLGLAALAPWVFFGLGLLWSCSDTATDRVGPSEATLLSSVELTPGGDTYLKNGSPNKNQGDEAILRVRQSGKNRILLQFDQAAIEAAVGSEPVYEARVEFTITQNGGQWGSSGRSVGIHRMTAPWSELGATWNCGEDSNTSNGAADCPTTSWKMDDSSEWPFSFAPTSTTLGTNETIGVFSFDVTEDVESFVSGTEPNLGLGRAPHQ